MKLVEKIKELWGKVVAWLKGTSSKVDDFMLKYAPVAISVVNAIKEFNGSYSADVVQMVLESVSGNMVRPTFQW